MKKKGLFIVYLSSILLLSTGIAVSSTIGLYEKGANGGGSFGEISLRSYFERGTGSSEDPYVITRPRHLYNLSRLQGLGVFAEKNFFQLGLEGLNGDTSGEPRCYLSDTSSDVVPFLDMQHSNYDMEPITAIGSESTPFYGEFDGQDLEIKNLTVYADPQDAGFFGYTASGSNVHNIFLDNVTINTMGYTDDYEGLYGLGNAAAVGAKLQYRIGNADPVDYVALSEGYELLSFNATSYFAWDGEGEAPAITQTPPKVNFVTNNPAYKYKFLHSGEFLVDDGEGGAVVDLEKLYEAFREQKSTAESFPVITSSSVSLVASMTDNYGLEHSKVLMTMVFTFTLASSTSNTIVMEARMRPDHGNNIGLVIGHCDGSVRDCYVHDGAFLMNNGNVITDSDLYKPMENGSFLGLIGLVGTTVHDLAAENSDSTTKSGKDIGVLDFTTVYNEIIGPSSFPSPQVYNNGSNISAGIIYNPLTGSKYDDYLRQNNSRQFVTKDNQYVSFRGQKVITNTDLGIFTLATDNAMDGMGGNAGTNLERSTIHKGDSPITYLYYATGEYNNSSGVSFANYRDALETNTPKDFHLGYHFPHTDELSIEGFAEREAHQNYFLRFELEKDYRTNTNTGLYFWDVDTTTPGGSFISKYFNYKLVDLNYNPIPAGTKKCGVMIRNVLGHEIGSLSASISTRDFSFTGSPSEAAKPRMYCLDDAENNYPVANSINFEIKTDIANVTVVAAPEEADKSAILGVYKIDGLENPLPAYLGNKYLPKSDSNSNPRGFEEPDYAFFMPKDNHLAYFDYVVDKETNKGKIGTYSTEEVDDEMVPVFHEADENTDATVPSDNPAGYPESKIIDDQPRLFAHTFKLPKGRYCLGAASGSNSAAAGTQTTPKIYYVCAQGQTDGQLQFNDTFYASSDVVDRVDFIKNERFTYNEGTKTFETNVILEDPAPYGPSSLERQRCYVLFKASDRSLFADSLGQLTFAYEDDKFKIASTTPSSMSHISVTNYGKSFGVLNDITGLENLVIKLMNLDDSSDGNITYSYTG